MIRGLFGAGTTPAMLRGGLDEVSATHRGIASRVANALTPADGSDFASQLDAQRAAESSGADLERDMAALADAQIRYESTAKLLQKAYARLRAAIRE